MRITSFEFAGPYALRLRFQDGAELLVLLETTVLSGPWKALGTPDAFSRARLGLGTVVWHCGLALDAELARIKADEAEVWQPRPF
jgi:hypothetical protein